MIGLPEPRKRSLEPLTSVGAAGGDVRWLRPIGIWIVAVTFGSLAMASVVALLVWDAFPQAFPPRAHLLLGSAPLALIAISSLLYQAAKRQQPLGVIKAAVLAAAFLFWAANQLLPGTAYATLFNDLAITLFVLDVFLTVVGRPLSLPREGFTATAPMPEIDPRSTPNNGMTKLRSAEVGHSDIVSADSYR